MWTIRSSQAQSKFSQIQQNLAKPGQRRSKNKLGFPWILLVRIERFQGVAPTPWPENIFWPPLSAEKHEAAMAYASGAGSQRGALLAAGRPIWLGPFIMTCIIAMFPTLVKKLFENLARR
jgi:hypothetical protein